MSNNPLFDSGQQAAHDPQRYLYARSSDELREVRESVAEENLAAAAGEKARRQRIIGIAIFLLALAVLAMYLIAQVLGR